MRSIFLTMIFLPLIGLTQVATNFTVKSCAGDDKKLFDLLDSGQIVILTWVAPDEVGVNYINTAYNVIKEFDANYPNRVSMFVCDDYGDTDCNSMSNWLSGRTFSTCLSFSDSTIRMGDYGLNGLPKFAVLGNSSHYIFNVQASNLNDSEFRDAINAALIGPVMQENLSNNNFGTTLSPNPCNTSLIIKYKAELPENLSLEIFDSFGKKVKSITPAKGNTVVNTISLDTTGLSPGQFLFRISDLKMVDTVKFVVAH